MSFERVRSRKRAREWLNADLALWTKTLDKVAATDRNLVRKTLGQWQADPALAGMRDCSALAALSADERKECKALWEAVAGAIDRLEKSK